MRHQHSHAAHAEIEADGTAVSREALVLECILRHGPMTDRAVMTRLGFGDPNAVRPRITALIQRGALVEIGSTVCPYTHKTVRLVGCTGQGLQSELPL